jgi:hypothetical protein
VAINLPDSGLAGHQVITKGPDEGLSHRNIMVWQQNNNCKPILGRLIKRESKPAVPHNFDVNVGCLIINGPDGQKRATLAKIY